MQLNFPVSIKNTKVDLFLINEEYADDGLWRRK